MAMVYQPTDFSSRNRHAILNNYDKNEIFIDGYFEKFNISLLKFKNYSKKFNYDGEINSYFKINLNSNLNIEKFNFKILNNSSIVKKVDGKSNQLQSTCCRCKFTLYAR